MPNPGSHAAKRLVIRFVTARLNAATHRFRNRIRRGPAATNTRTMPTHMAMFMADSNVWGTGESMQAKPATTGLGGQAKLAHKTPPQGEIQADRRQSTRYGY